jgi:hypothetical protein
MTARHWVQLDLQLRPSKILLCFVVISHLLAGFAVWLSAVNVGLAVFLSLAVILHGIHCRQTYCLGTWPHGIAGCVLRNEEWYLQYQGAERVTEIRADLCDGFRLTSRFVSVRFKEVESGRCHDLALFSDSADPDQLRRLRVWLGLLGSR